LSNRERDRDAAMKLAGLEAVVRDEAEDALRGRRFRPEHIGEELGVPHGDAPPWRCSEGSSSRRFVVTARQNVGIPRGITVASRTLMTKVVIPLLLALTGCVPSALEATRVRASREFQCPLESVRGVARPDLSPATIEVTACGQTAIYTCPVSAQEGKRTCIRER
jgi:hypothetical protein